MDIEVRSVKVRNRVKAVLVKEGLAQEEAARRAGVSFRHFNRVVLGHTVPTLTQALAIAQVLGRPLEELFSVTFRTRKARVGRG